jgi:DNA-binding transcriptional LysR family regulator
MGVDTEDMAVFLAVVRHGSFGRAASSLLLSQPSVSERIARLERTLGSQLFDRGARGARLTPAGEQLVPYARRLSDLFEEATRRVAAEDGPGALRVAVHATFAHRALPLVLAATADEPRQIVIRDAHSDQIIAMLLDGVIDIGFVVPVARPRPLQLVALPADPIVAVCAPTHPLANTIVSPSELRGHRVALNRWGDGAFQFLAQLWSVGVSESGLTECSDSHTALVLVRDYLHVALVGTSIARPDLESGAVVRLRMRPAPRWSLPLSLAYRASEHNEPVIAKLRTLLVGDAIRAGASE